MRTTTSVLSAPPKAKANRRYYWALDSATAGQGYAAFRLDGWRIVPAKEAKELGLEHLASEDGVPVVKDAGGAIRYLNHLLMDLPVERWEEMSKEKVQLAEAQLQSYEDNVAEAQDRIHAEARRN